MVSINSIKKKYDKIKLTLNEKSRRMWCATEAHALGYGGISKVATATGVTRQTIAAGIKEITSRRGRPPKKRRKPKPEVRIRKKGGGAKSVLTKRPDIKPRLEELVEPDIKGDPETPLRWTTKSIRKLTAVLQEEGFDVCHTSVSRILKISGYTLQLNRKEKAGTTAPDRDAQFNHINEQTKSFHAAGQPVISVDTKKKELVGEFKNNGREYRPKGKARKVNDHDFMEDKGKVAPYGVYDLGKNKGWVSVGVSCDTAEFAVNSIRSWWYDMGKKDYPNATKIMITADCGGSNGNRVKLWKWELQKFANEINREMHVCHYPAGTSKWNKIEHRLFCHISQNWKGVPLISHEVIIQLIGSTKTTTGLQVKAKLDTRHYEKGVTVEDEDFDSIAIIKNTFHGEWNYKILPVITCRIV